MIIKTNLLNMIIHLIVFLTFSFSQIESDLIVRTPKELAKKFSK